MTTEEKLKMVMKSRYGSVNAFAISNDIPQSTIASIFARGINKSSITSVISICKALGISVDALVSGEIEFTDSAKTTQTDLRQLLPMITFDLDNRDLTLNGTPLSSDEKETLIDSVTFGIELIEKGRKRK